ncbi:MAG: hypothetical protein R3200_12775 [Xanthomonadales bacterium]|nr:hypothetical protein [Xanthomonadales bacterium]
MRALVFFCFLAFGCAAYGAEGTGRAGHGHISLTYQYIAVDGFTTGSRTAEIGTTDTHGLNFHLDYAVTDRWTVGIGVPLITKRWNGPSSSAHRPDLIDPPQDQEFIDDGEYHTEWQDLHLTASYAAKTDGPLTIEPFMAAGIPTHDYPHFAHAAVGQNLWRFEAGARIFYQPHFSRFYYGFHPRYVFVEETLDTSVDHWLIDAEIGYFFNSSVSVRTFLIHKDGDGVTSTAADFPDRTSPRWFQHDRMLIHNFTNLGVGVDWQVSPKYRLSFSAMTQVDGEWVHIMDYTGTFTVSRSF